MACTLADLDAMSLEQAQALPFAERDQLLDLIIADGRHQSTDAMSYRVGLYCDYFDEDLTRMLKVWPSKRFAGALLHRGLTALLWARPRRSSIVPLFVTFRPPSKPPESAIVG